MRTKRLWLSLLLTAGLMFNTAFARTTYASSSEDENEPSQFQTDFEALYEEITQLDRFVIELSTYNLDQNKHLSSGKIVGDRDTGDTRFVFEFYETDEFGNEQQINFDLISYRDFDMAYVNLPELLNDSGFYKQEHFSNKLKDEIQTYQQSYTAIDSQDTRQISFANDVFESLLFLPESSLIEQIPLSNVWKLNDLTLVQLERLEIPRLFFNYAGQFQLDYQLNLEVSESEHRIKNYDVEASHQIDISQNTPGFNINLTLDSEITDLLLPMSLVSNDEVFEDYTRDSSLNTNHITDKLTHVNLIFNEKEPAFKAVLTGLFEEMTLNIFTSETADFESYNHRLFIQIRETDEEIPRPDDISTMTMAEFEYILETYLLEE